MDDLIRRTNKQHNVQREREIGLDERFISLSEHMYDQQVAMKDSFVGLCNDLQKEREKLRSELEEERRLIHLGLSATEDSDQLVYCEQQVAYLKIKLQNSEDANAKQRADHLNSKKDQQSAAEQLRYEKLECKCKLVEKDKQALLDKIATLKGQVKALDEIFEKVTPSKRNRSPSSRAPTPDPKR